MVKTENYIYVARADSEDPLISVYRCSSLMTCQRLEELGKTTFFGAFS